MFKSLLAYWPVVVFVAQILGILLVLWVDAKARDRVDKATEPMKAGIRDLENRLTKAETRLDDVEGDIGNLPTKADLANVMGEVRGAHQEAAAANAGIRRLEGFIIAKGLETAG